MMRSVMAALNIEVRFDQITASVGARRTSHSCDVRLGPVIVVGGVGYYVWSGRDSDSAAMLRRQVDERQAYRQLKIQALVGGGAAVAYLAAFAAKATLWPFVIFLALFVVALLAGWVIYRERGDGRDDRPRQPR